MKKPHERAKPVVEDNAGADAHAPNTLPQLEDEKPAVVTPAPDKNPAAQPEPVKPHERYEHPERGA